MNKIVLVVVLLLTVVAGGVLYYQAVTKENSTAIPTKSVESVETKTKPLSLKEPAQQVTLHQSHFIAQSFNNCGPASLSMILSMYGTTVSQEELAERMRPFNNPEGGVDDKSVFAREFVETAKVYGFESLERPNGSIALLKKLTANGIPVVVRTWLNPHEDIGHFRIVRGYDDSAKTILQDDSYQGPNLTYSYGEFMQMWQPFNYGYILVYPKAKEKIVEAILSDEMNSNIAWQHALSRAEHELATSPDDPYVQFNIATAHFYLGNYKKTIEYYKLAKDRLPDRMLWYQYEPIEAYLHLKMYDTVFGLTNEVLNTGNKAYSELYVLRGKAYVEQGRVQDAEHEFEQAVYYNKNSQLAKDALASVK